MRIQRWLAQLGFGSRREIEKSIQAGNVLINGRRAVLGDTCDGGEHVIFEGKKVTLSHPRPLLIMLHKPYGCITSRKDPDNRPTVYQMLPPCPHGQWQNVGRLDFATSGLILFTNQGQFVERLTHPKHKVRRGYKVKCQGAITPHIVQRLQQGIRLEDGIAKVDLVEVKSHAHAKNTVLYLEVSEGRNRLVRRIMDRVGLPVMKLKRLRYGPWVLPDDLLPGQTCPIASDHWPHWLKSL